jgi:Zn-dependent protease with chaperone function
LAAMACYNTHRAASVFQRLHEKEQVPSTGNKLFSFANSHPPTDERYRDLVLASESENADSYDNCTAIKKKMASAGLRFW